MCAFPVDGRVTDPSITPAPPPGILVADRFTQPHGYHVHRPHGTHDWLITYTVAGAGIYQLAGRAFVCRSGDVVLLEPGTPHHYATETSSEPWSFYWSHFWPHHQWASWLQLPEVVRGLRIIALDDEMVQARAIACWERLLTDSHGVTTWQMALALNALEELLILLAQQQARGATSAEDYRVESVLHYLNQHFHESINVNDLAELVALSPSRLAHLFKAHVGTSIVAALLETRLRQAARLLIFTSLEIQEVAQQVGFQSVFYFSRRFKDRYGISPSAYRRRERREED
ncbi:MAG: helix-turn-helix domain-containing protein [Caldilineaceae bacterium]